MMGRGVTSIVHYGALLAMLMLLNVPQMNAEASHLIILKERPSAGVLKSFATQLGAAEVHAQNQTENLRADPRVISIGELHILPTMLKNDEVHHWQNKQEVSSVETDLKVRVAQLPITTQQRPPSWGLDRIDQRGLPLNNKYTYIASAGEGVTAYIIDTGIDVANPDFGGRATWGTTTIDNAPNSDDNGHGTFVSGIVGGTNYGVAKKVNLVAVKSLDYQGEGYLSNILRGMEWTYNNYRVKIADVPSSSLIKSRTMNSAVAELTKAGMLVVWQHSNVAAGNGDERGRAQNACNFSPSSAPEALTVGAIDITDTVASWSNYGDCVDIVGPGDRVRSLDVNNPQGSIEDSGTSFSTPYTTGVGALALGASNSTISPGNLKKLILGISTKNTVKGDLRGTPNQLLYNMIDTVPIAAVSTSASGDTKNHASSWSIAGAVVFLSVWMWM
ncbi:peptidase S8/S53 domain-containing protein [Syncephalis plumigaleata]|nr:peptidase S8/S53 domain-containing protein [Syncephalis plumigaleata]